jgi:hypothetical protein
MSHKPAFTQLREEFHRKLLESILFIDQKSNAASNADSGSLLSKNLASSIYTKIGGNRSEVRAAGQTSGNKFEEVLAWYLESTFLKLQNLRPGTWQIRHIKSRNRVAISEFEQYRHLADLEKAAKQSRELRVLLGSDYTISPDVIIARQPEEDDQINRFSNLVDNQFSRKTPLRAINNSHWILHASISCKWTLRSDRAQNARTEALNLIRKRKGHQPHIVVVTGEPMPSRIASLALGTGDIDCVYHITLPELEESVLELQHEDSQEILRTMVDGNRLRDISDLPFDLAI